MKKLKLGKGTLFVKSQMKRLDQGDDVWQADFRALPKPMDQADTHYLGLVVGDDGVLLAHRSAPYTPDVNDLAQLLAHAIRRPPVGRAHRPRLVRVRPNPRWEELFPHLQEIGIEISTQNELVALDDCFVEVLQKTSAAQQTPIIQLTREKTDFSKAFPALDRWVKERGWIEIGEQESLGFVARALDAGGLVFEAADASTLADAMAVLEAGLRLVLEETGKKRL